MVNKLNPFHNCWTVYNLVIVA